ncbi:MAG: cytochrome c peroxidase [Polyangiaceae bacterium]
MKVHSSLLGAVLAACALVAAASGCDEPTSSGKPGASASAATATASASASAAKPLPPMPKADPLPDAPKYAAEMKVPADNPMTAEKVFLGKQLFFDKRLSGDGTASCQTCHWPEKGWTDGEKTSKKVGGGMNTRHSPTLYNAGYNDLWYWDGRAPTLEKQVIAAWKGQMGADADKSAEAIAKIPGYEVQFKAVFGANATADNVVKALAAFVRSLRAPDAPWDKIEKDEADKSPEAEAARRGFAIFRDKAGCAACHAPPMFTDNGFHNVGIGFDKDVKDPDPGRGKVTGNKEDTGKFKTPMLRQVASHPPYFHDGRAATLDEAVDYMLSGGLPNDNLDKQLKKVTLTKAERDDLIAFLKSLEAAVEPMKAPALP